MMVGVIAGVDGGGSKTVCRIKNPGHSGVHFQECISGSSNPQTAGLSVSLQTVADLVDRTLFVNGIAPRELSVVAVGIAGLRTTEEKTQYQAKLKETFLTFEYSKYCKIKVENDAVIALRSYVHPPHPGILLASGTGSIAYGIDSLQKEWRSGGWGWLIGDEGSGWWIGWKTLQTAAATHDGRNEAGQLLEAVLNEWNLEDPARLTTAVYQSEDPRKKIADLTRMTARLAEEGDFEAEAVLEEAGRHLSNLLINVYEKSRFFPVPVPVILQGSVLNHIPAVRESVEAGLCRKTFRICDREPGKEPVEGALNTASALAMDIT
ncbi:N-acetylglucosamine kinase [Salibacterium sp. K-3]